MILCFSGQYLNSFSVFLGLYLKIQSKILATLSPCKSLIAKPVTAINKYEFTSYMSSFVSITEYLRQNKNNLKLALTYIMLSKCGIIKLCDHTVNLMR